MDRDAGAKNSHERKSPCADAGTPDQGFPEGLSGEAGIDIQGCERVA
jgi:hypothetical protein